MSERLDRAEAILLAVAEQTAENSRIVVENSRAIAANNSAITTINQTLQTLVEDRVELYNILESLAQEIRQNTRDIAELRVSTTQLQAAAEQQNRAITYLMSKD